MRVLHCIGQYLPEVVGGTQLQLADLASWQRDRGWQPEIFCVAGPGTEPPGTVTAGEYEGIPVVSYHRGMPEPGSFRELYAPREIARAFERHLEARRPDLVHIHHLSGLSPDLVYIAEGHGVPVLLLISDLWLQCLRGQRFHPHDRTICEPLDRHRCLECMRPVATDLLAEPPIVDRGDGQRVESDSLRRLHAWEADMQRTVRACSAVVVLSPSHRRIFVEWGAPVERIHVVDLGLDKLRDFEPQGGSRPVRKIGFTGLVIPSKGVHLLVEAFRRLARPELELEIHGEIPVLPGGTSYEDELKTLAAGSQQIRFFGRYSPDRVGEILRRLDVLVVPSLWWEGYCLTAREGLLAGLPVVTFGLGGLEALVHAGEVLQVEPSVESLAGGLARLCDEPELRDRLRRGAGRTVPTVADSSLEFERIYRLARAG